MSRIFSGKTTRSGSFEPNSYDTPTTIGGATSHMRKPPPFFNCHLSSVRRGTSSLQCHLECATAHLHDVELLRRKAQADVALS